MLRKFFSSANMWAAKVIYIKQIVVFHSNYEHKLAQTDDTFQLNWSTS